MTIGTAIKELVELGNLLGMDAEIYTRNAVGDFTSLETITQTIEDSNICIIDGEDLETTLDDYSYQSEMKII